MKKIPWDELLPKADSIKSTSESRFVGDQFSEIKKAKSHQIEAEEIDAIRASNSKGLRVIDIDPNQLNRTDNFCIYQHDVIERLVGTEDNNEAGVTRIDNAGNPNPKDVSLPYWRTVFFNIPGNFLKIEYLPARVVEGATARGAADIKRILANIQPNIYPQNSNVLGGGTLSASKKAILLDFENPTDAPHFVRSGHMYNTTFSSFYLTFKQMSPRIRITVGYNSTIATRHERPDSLALWNGDGITDQSMSSPVPFSITDREVTSGTTFNGITVNPGSAVSNPLFYCDPTYGDIGVAVMFLTGFSGMIWPGVGSSVSSYSNIDFEILIGQVNAIGGISSISKRIAGFTAATVAPSGTTQAYNFYSTASNFEAIRVTLKTGEGLILRLTPLNGTNASNCKFEAKGYYFGTMRGSGFNGTYAPFILDTMFREHPYPEDNNTYGFPKF